MGRPLSRADAEAILRTDQGGALFDALRRLPDDVDPRLAADAVASFLGGPSGSKRVWLLGRHGQRLPAPVIRELLADLGQRAVTVGEPGREVSIFITALVSPELPDGALVDGWQAALVALLDLNTTYGWGSKQRREKIRAVAANPEMVGAIQAVAVGCEDTSLDMLAVLCADGSDASFDALMPHFDHAERSGKRLEWLGRLRKHANPESKGVQSLLDTAATRLAALSEGSPAVALAAQIGLGRPKVFWFDASFGSSTLTDGNVPLYQGHIHVNSRSPAWFSVSVVRLGSLEAGGFDWATSAFASGSRANRRDDLDLGRCAAADLPEWLRRASDKLRVAWSLGLRTSLRGKKRQALERWLLGECDDQKR